MRRPEGDERGFTILETVIALGLFAVIIAGVAVSMSLGLGLVGGSSARQSATHIANQEIERQRALGYASLGHTTVPSPSPDPDNPDHDIEPAGAPSCSYPQACYRVPDIGLETFVATGSTQHVTTGVAREGQRFTVYRYVTVVNADNRLKRLTVVVQGSGTGPNGRPNRVTLSTVFSTGVITF